MAKRIMVAGVFIMRVAPAYREPDPTIETIYLCYDEDTPLPNDEPFFIAKDKNGKQWTCHELAVKSLNKKEIQKVARRLLVDYQPKTVQQTIKCKTKPVVVFAAAVRAVDEDELVELLGEAPAGEELDKIVAEANRDL